MEARRSAILAGWTALLGAVAGCAHDWDDLDPRLGEGGASAAAASSGGGPAAGSGGASSASTSEGAGGAAGGAGAGTGGAGGGPPAGCGDGVIAGAEQCDDANETSGDGCDACEVECDGADEHVEPQTFTCYRLAPMADWPTARDDCKAWDGHLAAVTSIAELDFVRTLISDDTWLGGNEIAAEDVWVWDSGEPWGFTAWNVGEPNDYLGVDEDCVNLHVSTGDPAPAGFNDDDCAALMAALCERAAPGRAGVPPP